MNKREISLVTTLMIGFTLSVLMLSFVLDSEELVRISTIGFIIAVAGSVVIHVQLSDESQSQSFSSVSKNG